MQMANILIFVLTFLDYRKKYSSWANINYGVRSIIYGGSQAKYNNLEDHLEILAAHKEQFIKVLNTNKHFLTFNITARNYGTWNLFFIL